ncbi:MAG TPA: hypothetical protein VKQ07_09960 [Jatrophihabitantaceae bacterium]|nr:hypothetical protein [Jatrophihabitantaceae bacterium]
MDVATDDRWALNHSVYVPGQHGGHYESFYQRANHPTRPLAFWIRYTIFAPRGRPADAIGEVWAVLFDGETGQHTVGKVELPMSECDFARDTFAVRAGDAALGPDALVGSAGTVSWDLTYGGDAPPLLLFPDRMYRTGFPKAKSLVALPAARFAGTVRAGDRVVDVDGWSGSQCHNWGSRHTDRYAFVQVMGFDGEPDTLLEAGTAKASLIGPLTTPWTTFVVLRHRGVDYRLSKLEQALRATGSYRWFDWTFSSGDADVEIEGHVHAPREAFVALRYRNPPGGEKYCVNTKIGTAEITLTDRGGARTVLRTGSRALFEILTDDLEHGVAIRA